MQQHSKCRKMVQGQVTMFFWLEGSFIGALMMAEVDFRFPIPSILQRGMALRGEALIATPSHSLLALMTMSSTILKWSVHLFMSAATAIAERVVLHRQERTHFINLMALHGPNPFPTLIAHSLDLVLAFTQWKQWARTYM